ncbi:MAG: hypothetical protein ACK4GT_20995, partial [Pararhodobacter sp.]
VIETRSFMGLPPGDLRVKLAPFPCVRQARAENLQSRRVEPGPGFGARGLVEAAEERVDLGRQTPEDVVRHG